MKREWSAGAALLALGVAGVLACAPGGPARAQVEMEAPLEQPVTLFVADRPVVSVTLEGNQGPLRVTGTLEEAPKEALRVTDINGRPRDATWNQVLSLARTQYPQEGLPVGSFQAALLSDAANTILSLSGSSGTQAGGTGQTYQGWRLLRLPGGTLTLRGAPYGTLTFPIERITGYRMEPIRGTVTELPKGDLKLEVLDNTVVAIPLQFVTWFRRDAASGTADVLLRDQQSFTGKVIELPKGEVQILSPSDEKTRQSIPLERIAAIQRTLPGGTLAGR